MEHIDARKLIYRTLQDRPRASKGADTARCSCRGILPSNSGKNHDVTGDFIAKWIELENITLSARDAAGASGRYVTQDLDECVSLVRQSVDPYRARSVALELDCCRNANSEPQVVRRSVITRDWTPNKA